MSEAVGGIDIVKPPDWGRDQRDEIRRCRAGYVLTAKQQRAMGDRSRERRVEVLVTEIDRPANVNGERESEDERAGGERRERTARVLLEDIHAAQRSQSRRPCGWRHPARLNSSLHMS